MADERDIAAELEYQARDAPLWSGKTDVDDELMIAAAAEIRRLQAELDAGHKQMDRAGVPRDHGSAPLGLAQRINLKLQALADMIEVRDDWVEQARTRVAELEAPAPIPDCPSIAGAFAELAEAAGPDANWDDLIAEKEAGRQGRHDLAAVLTTTDGRVLGFEGMEGCRAFMAAADRDLLGTVWTRNGYMAEARDWLARQGAGEAGRDGEGGADA